jgi:adenine-specific DNA-methyltransferase
MFGNKAKKGQLDLTIEHKAGISIRREDIETLIHAGEQFSENEAIFLKKEQKIKKGEQKTTSIKLKLSDNIRKNAKLIDDKLAEITVCDPAVGSGAFPVGMMSEIVKARNVLSVFIDDKKRKTYNFKRQCIEHSLYGVDIDPGAVEIAKLREWLSLVVDEQDIKNIKPLPNLDYRIMQGNSLIELLSTESLANTIDYKRTELVKELKKAKDELFNITNPTQKENKRRELDILMKKLFEYDRDKQIKRLKDDILAVKSQQRLFEDDKDKKEDEKKIRKIESRIEEIKNIDIPGPTEHFEWYVNYSEIFQEKGGFDIVIANPPYMGERGYKEIFQETKKGSLSKFYQRKMDIFYFLFHLALNLGKQNSSIAFITTNYYPTATGATKLRQDFKKRAIIKNLINFNELKIFESALGQHNMITVLEKARNENRVAQTCITQRQGSATPEILQQILNGNDEKTNYYKVMQKDLYDGNECYIRLIGNSKNSKNSIQTILEKIKSKDITLGHICNVNQGILTGADKVSNKHIKKFPKVRFIKGEGIYVLNNNEVKKIVSKEILKPWFKNSSILKYYTKVKSDEYLLYLTRDINLSDYKDVQEHIIKFEKIIKNRPKDRGEIQAALKLGKWWVVFATRKSIPFNSAKIVVPQRSQFNTFGYNEIPWYASADVYFITEKDKSVYLKYVLALLNSKLYYFWLYHRGKRKGEMLELYQKPLSEIPIKKISEDEQKSFIEIVDKILSITQSNDYYLQNPQKQAKVKALGSEIDQLVYKLYDLTPEEIKIVEGKKSK